MGLVLPVAQVENSRLTHACATDFNAYETDIGSPGVPKSEGSTAVNPRAATRRANAATSGVMPGTSWITITAGPEPNR
jgi:hypothetical protein